MELSLAVSPGELTRAEQKILDYKIGRAHV